MLRGIHVDLVVRPADERVEFEHRPLGVPFDKGGLGAGLGVDAAYPTGPGGIPSEGLVERRHFAHGATPVGVAIVQPRAELGILLGHGLLRQDGAQGKRQHRRHGIPGPDRLGEVVAGVEEEDIDARGRIGGEVQKDLIAHRTRHREPGAVGSERPTKQIPGESHPIPTRASCGLAGKELLDLGRVHGRTSPGVAARINRTLKLRRHARQSQASLLSPGRRSCSAQNGQ